MGTLFLFVLTAGFVASGNPGPTVVTLQPGDDIQAAVNIYPPNTEFFLTAGTYRLQEIRPKDGQRFVGELGKFGERLTTLSGAKVLSNWEKEGQLWYVAGQKQHQWEHGECLDPVCRRAEELFAQGKRVLPVLTLDELRPGRWCFDYAAARIYIAEDPTGKLIETSVANRAIIGPANDVVVRDLIIEKYANQAQHGAVDSREHNSAPVSSGRGWLVENSEIRWNHAVGVRVNEGGTVRGNFIHHNGQLGLAAGGSGISVVNNEIAENHFGHFKHEWEAGGAKFAKAIDLRVESNHVHNNDGPGIWCDIDCNRVVITGNRVVRNGRAGIFYEISSEGRIEKNIVIENGFDFPAWGWGGGIVVAASFGVAVIKNTLMWNADGIVGIQQDRGAGPQGPRVLEDLLVSGNCVAQREGLIGVVQDTGDPAPFTDRNNRFMRNTYQFADPHGPHFAWLDRSMSLGEWGMHHPSDGRGGFCIVMDQ